MTKDEIGDLIEALPQGLDTDEFIYRLINWAVDIEREACAKVCEQMTHPESSSNLAWAARSCAAAIRARGEKS